MLNHKSRILRFIVWLEVQMDRTILVIAHEETETMQVFVVYFERDIEDDRLRNLHVKNCEYKYYFLTH
ncbi:hypothetical protein C7H79_06175 [Nitrosomonas supralitoralis]|uniref:Uncharacterized protein n=1 Tax=Nitrosomonas supralitoralis TaxID=2116706 RepID=A0A2P7NWJ2_9PROT|nr:hypothetical protein C7H79_06175 [Nitrosomonas supralitoralis]